MEEIEIKKTPKLRKNGEPKKTGLAKPEQSVYKRRNQYTKVWTTDKIEQLADEMLEYFKVHEEATYFTHFSTQHGINRRNIYTFRDSNDYFKEIYERVKDILISRLMDRGMSNKNPAFPIFTLKNLANEEFRDKPDIEINVGVKVIKDDI